MNRYLMALLIILFPSIVWAEGNAPSMPPGMGQPTAEEKLQQVIAAGHQRLGEVTDQLLSTSDRLIAAQKESQEAHEKSAASESRLKWVLDNWVPKSVAESK